MEVRDRIISILLDLTISAYVLLALSLIAGAILDSRKQCRPRSIRSKGQSRTDSDYRAIFRKRGWLNRWLPAKSEMNLPAGPRNIKAAMDSGFITTLAALGGTAIGGFTSFFMSWTTLSAQMKAKRHESGSW